MKAVSEKLQVPQDTLHQLPCVVDSLCSPKPQPGEKGKRRRCRRKEQRLLVPLAPYWWIQLTAAQDAALLSSLGAEIHFVCPAKSRPASSQQMHQQCLEHVVRYPRGCKETVLQHLE